MRARSSKGSVRSLGCEIHGQGTGFAARPLAGDPLRSGARTEDASARFARAGPPPERGVRLEILMPAEHRAGGADLALRWGVHETPFGPALFVTSPRGLARLAFLAEGGLEAALAEARADWPYSPFLAEPSASAHLPEALFDRAFADPPLSLLLKGTAFQIAVWRALLRIPEGRVTTYGALAAALGRPGAARAVGAACGRNRIGWLIPCHRVIREDGSLGGYHWGVERKRAMLAFEAARAARLADAA